MDRQINPKERYKIITLGLLLISDLVLGSFLRVANASPRSKCRVVARVAYSTNPADLFKPLCAGQNIALPANTKAVCLANLKIISVRTTKDLELCNEVNQSAREACGLIDPSQGRSCEGVSRTTLDASRPLLEAPYGVVLRSQPLLLRWRAVDGADAYRVIVEGDRNRLRVVTATPSLRLTLQKGTVSIIVQALRSAQVISRSVKTFDVISEEKSKSLNSKLKQIDDSKIPDYEKSLVRVAILNQHELLNESKEYLENRVKLSKSPQISIALADLYLRLGLFAESKRQYVQTISLAKTSNNVDELERAREGYRTISIILDESLEPRS